ncbi:aminotransferase class I/II-fold pyridoxal phosphate-dependent enzyme [Lunatibacter salilacus]|uniref:aminotransferase class I/II-fold pyridoxal phosphate-dependent enzyme n=1 Tax=Lunatibacter salilacus TaxID=2483804 RepID=UPI00131ABBF6|nr:aminotransferase class I/II-fold pyridoxal phosphate-dependent enzyme [Lunatibacter salilacus]
MGKHLVTDRANSRLVAEGEEYLQFAGTAYLGMSQVPAFEKLLIEGIKKYGANHGSSRHSNVQLAIYDTFELYFAAQTGAEKVRLLSSGFLAGHLAVEFLRKEVDLIWVAPDAHPAILPQGQSGNPHQSFDSWSQQCLEKSKNLMGQRIGILSNAVNPLKPQIHDFGWITELAPVNEYFVLIDDSHAFGVVGDSIFGTYSQWKHVTPNLLVCGSLGKALSLPAGVILGSKNLLDKVDGLPIFRSSSPPAPAFLHAFLNGQDLYKAQHKKLRENTAAVFQSIQSMLDFTMLDGFPVVTFQERGWVEKLLEEKIIASSFPYPGPLDSSLNRLVLTATHSREDLSHLITVLKSLKN